MGHASGGVGDAVGDSECTRVKVPVSPSRTLHIRTFLGDLAKNREKKYGMLLNVKVLPERSRRVCGGRAQQACQGAIAGSNEQQELGARTLR